MSLAFDVLVLGSGPAGEKAAIQAAKAHKRVAIIERGERVGGSCLHTGTIPSKTLRETILQMIATRERAAARFQAAMSKDLTLAAMMERKDTVIRGQAAVVESHLSKNDVTVFEGTAHFIDPHHLEVVEDDGARRVVSGEVILIATGSRPARPLDIPFDDESIYDSDTILKLDRIPHSLTVVGGGVIGCEYACMFAALGAKVTVMDTRTRVLDFADREIAELLVARMRDRGIVMRLGEEVAKIELERPGRVLAITMSWKQVVSEKLLYAVGREGNTAELDLGAAGLQAARRGLLEVNPHFQTAVPHIYAAGDVIGFPSLAATSQHQGRLAMARALGVELGGECVFLPYGVYTMPEISMVGETEEQLTAANVSYEVGHAFYREIARGAISGERTGMLKLLFERETHRLRGVHIIGSSAAELVHIGQAVLVFGGPVDYFVETVFNYPTLSEAYKVAALNGLNRL
ncbi:MAG: Si-specific NAD(P)(+) transhydrogenase [Candidatus Binatia bacterium]